MDIGFGVVFFVVFCYSFAEKRTNVLLLKTQYDEKH